MGGGVPVRPESDLDFERDTQLSGARHAAVDVAVGKLAARAVIEGLAGLLGLLGATRETGEVNAEDLGEQEEAHDKKSATAYGYAGVASAAADSTRVDFRVVVESHAVTVLLHLSRTERKSGP